MLLRGALTYVTHVTLGATLLLSVRLETNVLTGGFATLLDRKEISFFCVHDTRQFTAKVRSGQVTLVPGSSAYCLFSLAKAGIVQPELLRKEARDAKAGLRNCLATTCMKGP